MSFNQIKDFLKEKLDAPLYLKWVDPLLPIGTVGETLFVAVPDRRTLDWLRENVLADINGFAQQRFQFTVKFVSLAEEEPARGTPDLPVEQLFPARMNRDQTFKSFVQLQQNQTAYAFAYSVTEFPGKSYNPLYIYGDVGLGKTHLLNAIGNRILDNSPNSVVIYITSNEFMSEYVEYTRLNRRTEFIKKYTSADVLLMDDIQYITKWSGTSEYFFNIFNSLTQQDKQIVLCADKHPDKIPDLEKRIKSRFMMGCLADLVPYDMEGRAAILTRKIEEREQKTGVALHIPTDVITFIASQVKDNVRRLEGALNRLLGYADLKMPDRTSEPITLAFAKEALRAIINFEKKSVTIDTIQEYVAEKYEIRPEELKSKNNSPKIALPRQIAMYLIKKLTKHSLAEIGAHFGNKHHTTVLHSIHKVEKCMAEDPDFSKKVESYVEFFTE